MGVKTLWDTVAPLGERTPLFNLTGKSVAIDLSGWVVDSQSVTDNHAQPKMYLRNLFFRTSFLLHQDIFPVFVLEGTAPNLKHKTIEKRNENRIGTQSKSTAKKGGRSQFNAVLRQCEEMLKSMGLFCLRGQGEAEAMCAYLDYSGFVDGCISQDSDCFLYGAKTVYRNFCTKSQGNRTTSQGSVDVYTINKIEEVLHLGRNKMIALALLCGCDYDNGVNGVGKEAALKLFKIVSDKDILDRLKSWKRDCKKYEKLEREISNPNICTVCGHEGKMRSHLKKGCVDCGTTVKCDDSYKEKRALINNELTIRKKALAIENFPSQDILDEYLIQKESELISLDMKWKQPNIHKFVAFMERHLCWEPEYSFSKIFPLMTRWQLLNLPELSLEKQQSFHFVIPKKIHKIRRRKGIVCYEIIWKDQENYLEGLRLTNTSDKENDEDDLNFDNNELVSIERQDDFKKCYPELVEEFEEARKPKKKATTRKRKAATKTSKENNRKMDDFVVKNPIQILEESLKSLNISPNITPKRKKKILAKSPCVKKNPQICRVMEVEKMNEILNGSLDRMFNEMTPEDFESDSEEDLSDIIDGICGINKKDDHEVIMQSLGDKNIKYNIDLTQDEFEDIDKLYIPLNERLKKMNEEKKLSIGINSFLNITD